MNITQSDRDALRASQQALASNTVIGRLVEHRTQNPRTYRRVSAKTLMNVEQDLKNEKPEVLYTPKYFGIEPITETHGLNAIEEVDEPRIPKTVKEIRSDLWINMDRIEFDKLEWMSTEAEKSHRDQSNKSTLFDIDGRAIPQDKLSSVEGHDVESLVDLLDSTYTLKARYALKVITRIAVLANMGYYDGAFNENILEALITKCTLRIRKHLDSSDETICLEAFKCLRAIVCNTQLDEVIIDRMHPLIPVIIDSNLWLQTEEMATNEFADDTKDSECVGTDVIYALIARTDILTRFCYILHNKIEDNCSIYRDCILDLLIRMARHSSSVCYILNNKELVKPIVHLFLSPSIIHDKKVNKLLSIKALKFIRILAIAIREFEVDPGGCEGYRPMDTSFIKDMIPTVQAYFSIDYNALVPEQAEHLFRLHIEVLRLMRVLFDLKKFHGDMTSIMALQRHNVFMNMKFLANLNATRQPGTVISADWQYAAHLIDLIGIHKQVEARTSENCANSLWHSFVRPVIYQWLTDLVREKYIPHLDVSIALAIAVHHDQVANQEFGKKIFDIMIRPILNNRSKKAESINQPDILKVLCEEACLRSQFHKFHKTNGLLRDPKGLPSFGFLSYNSSDKHQFKLSPIVEFDSPYILLHTFINKLRPELFENQQDFRNLIDTPQLISYIKQSTQYQRNPTSYEYVIHNSMLAQFEAQIVGRLLTLLTKQYLGMSGVAGPSYANDEVEELEASVNVECYSNICHYLLMLIGLLNSNFKMTNDFKDHVFQKILLDKEFALKTSKEVFVARDYFDIGVESFLSGKLQHHMLSFASTQILMPIYMSSKQSDRFWIFQPVLDYYLSQIKDQPKKTEKWFENVLVWRNHTSELTVSSDERILAVILNFHASMMYFSPMYLDLVVKPNAEDYICYLACLYLDDEIFHDHEVVAAVSKNLKCILSYKPGMKRVEPPFTDASRVIRSLHITAADFFNNPLSDKVFRRKLFQEKAATVLRQMRMGLEDLWAPMDLFFSEEERDPEMKSLLVRSMPYICKGSFLEHYCKFHTCTTKV